MAAPKNMNSDGISGVVKAKVESNEPTVRVLIPRSDDEASDVAVDQTENVVINGKVTQIRRGEYVDVKVPVFLQLKNRYPNL